MSSEVKVKVKVEEKVEVEVEVKVKVKVEGRNLKLLIQLDKTDDGRHANIGYRTEY